MQKVMSAVEKIASLTQPAGASSSAPGNVIRTAVGPQFWVPLIRFLTFAMALVWLFSPPPAEEHDSWRSRTWPLGENGGLSCSNGAIAHVAQLRAEQQLLPSSPMSFADMESVLAWQQACLSKRDGGTEAIATNAITSATVMTADSPASDGGGVAKIEGEVGDLHPRKQTAQQAKELAQEAKEAVTAVRGQVQSLQELLGSTALISRHCTQRCGAVQFILLSVFCKYRTSD